MDQIRSKYRSIVIILIVAISLSLVATPFIPNSEAFDPSDEDIERRVERLMESMTIRQKIGQLFMVSLGGKQISNAQIEFLQKYQPGGVVLFGSNVEGRTPEQVTLYTNTLQETIIQSAGIPLLIAVDHEGGRVQRLMNGFTLFPEPSILGASGDPEIAFLVGQAYARELKAVGINMNLAPVADLLTRQDMLNPHRVLNHRTMSEDPQIVGELAGAMTQGMADLGVIGVIKHFPGHSPTDTDSHRELATISLDRETFEQTNLLAFALAVQNGAEAVMVGHLYYPAMEPVENLPATLSPTMIGILRNDLAFDGLVMTDAMEMGAIVNSFSIPDASIMALNAGIDMLAMGTNASFADQIAALDKVYEAVDSDDLSMEQVDESVRRVLMIKAKHGLLDWESLDAATANERMHIELSREAIIRMFEAGFTVVFDERQLLPLQPEDKVAIIYPIGKPTIQQECSTYLPDATFQGYSFVPADWEYGAAQAKARDADKVVVIAENVGWNIGQGALVASLPAEKMIYVSLWKPYDFEAITPPPVAFTVAYSTFVEAQIALCRVLTGTVPASGHLPMAIRDFELGQGVTYDRVEPE